MQIKLNNLLDIIKFNSKVNPNVVAQMEKNSKGVFLPITYFELQNNVNTFSAALYNLGVKKNDLVGLISENRSSWLVSDLAILSLGAADVPRGLDVTDIELEQILGETEVKLTIVENVKMLDRLTSLKDKLPKLSQIIVLDDKIVNYEETPYEVYFYSSLMEIGKEEFIKNQDTLLAIRNSITPDDLATIIFTSGTTGKCKGVMLTHNNFIVQIYEFPNILRNSKIGEKWLAILPVWHSLERIAQYGILSLTHTIAYSKPLPNVLLRDFNKVNPHYLASVPRVWENIKNGVFSRLNKMSKVNKTLFNFFFSIAKIYSHNRDLVLHRIPRYTAKSKIVESIVGFVPFILFYPLNKLGQRLVFKTIKSKMGKNLKCCISGGGALSSETDAFYNAIGLKIIDGYGLTETAPVIAIRDYSNPVNGTLLPLKNVVIKITDDDNNPLGANEKGIIKVKGPQIMKGYYKREDLTNEIIDQDGFLNTGDLGIWTTRGEFSIVGRAKDTIVLLGGENLEPSPIEAILRENEFIESAVVVGHNKKYLSALIVPQLDAIKNLNKEEVFNSITTWINNTITEAKGFKPFERVCKIKILDNSFEIGKELSAKQEIKRFVIENNYKDEIAELYA